MRTRPASLGDLLELHISLRDIEPAIWRRVHVPAEITLDVLHAVIQVAFGWKNCHLHDFFIGNICFSAVDGEEERLSVDEHAAPLGAVARVGSRFLYHYDYGDGWEHEVKVERVMDGGDELIMCLGGARACPPEDCGGPDGYTHLIEVLGNPKDEEYAEMRRWVGRGFAPDKFDMAAANKKLATMWKRLGRGRK